jgi:glycosyltransferase involved in cell wall biosynthesis
MRVLHVVRSFRPETGGLAEAVRALAVAQRQRGDAVTLVSLDPSDRERGGSDAPIVILGRSSHGYGYTKDYLPWLRTHGAEFDAVVVHGLWQYQTFGTWRALRGTATPYLIYCHGMLDVWFKQAHPLKHAKKWLYWPWAEYRALRDAAAVCFTAEAERKRARRSFWLYRARERITPIGIDSPSLAAAAAQRTAFRTAYPIMGDRPFLLFLGRIHPKKGLDLLLRAYATVVDDPRAPMLVIAGPGEEAYSRELRAEAAAIGLASSIAWLPMLTGDVKWGALHACEAFVLFSHQENFGVAVVEALACGRPVLISDQIAIHAEIAGDGAGFSGPDDVAGATVVMEQWRRMSPAARAGMSQAARSCFERRFESGRAAEALAQLVDEIKNRR